MALDTLQKICEDNAKDLNEATLDNDNTPVLDFIIPRLIPFNSNPISRLRVLAISATNHFVQLKSASILNNMTAYLESLFLIATDENTEVRQEVCRSFVMLLDNFTESLLPYLDQLIEYMIFCNQSQNTKVALEACDFWHQFSRLDSIHSHLVPFLPKVIPVILNSLIYTEEDLLMFGGGDEQEDLHPRFNSRFRSSRHHRQYESSDDENDDQEEDEFFSEWTLRKFSATSLEALTSTFKSQVTDILLPLLNHALFSQDWRVVESGILALGAAAEGNKESVCITYIYFFKKKRLLVLGGIDEISPHLPDMIPFLITNLSNTNVKKDRQKTCRKISIQGYLFIFIL